MKDTIKEKDTIVYTIHIPNATVRKESAKETAEKSCNLIDKNLFRYKAQFILYFGAIGTILPYVPLIARSRIGLSATSLGVVLTAQLFISVFTKPIMGFITDYFNKPKLILISLVVVQTVSYFLLLLIPSFQPFMTSELSMTSSNIFKSSNSVRWIINFRINSTCEDQINKTLCMENFSTVRFTDTNCIINSNKSLITCVAEQDSKKGDFPIKFTTDSKCCFVDYLGMKEMFNESNSENTNITRTYLEPSSTFLRQNQTISHSAFFSQNASQSDSTENQTNNDFQTSEFWFYALLMTITGSCYSAITTLGDTICLEGVQKYRGDFGRQRMFGAISWGVLAPISGLLCDFTNDFLMTCIFMTVIQCLTIWNIFKMDIIKPQISTSILKDAWALLRSPEFLMVELGMLMNGIGYGIVFNYLIWYLESIGASKFLCGMVHYAECFVGDLPFMFFSGWFLKKLGHFNLISLSLLGYAVRFMGYYYVQNPWFIIPLEITHGFTYGTFYPAVASYGKLRAKPGSEATTQSILFSTHEGLGAGMGCVLAGIGFDHLGGRDTFFYLSIFAFSATLLNTLNIFWIRRRTEEFEITVKTSYG